MGLPPYPVLPVGTPLAKVDEIRRTVTVVGIDSTVSAQACMDLFAEAGEVKYFRFCTRPNDPVKYALIEFSDISSVGPALQLNDRTLGLSKINVTHSVQVHFTIINFYCKKNPIFYCFNCNRILSCGNPRHRCKIRPAQAFFYPQ